MGIILNYVETEAIKNHSHLRIIPIVLFSSWAQAWKQWM